MKALCFLAVVLAGLVLGACGSNDPAPDAGLPPAATKEAGETRASESGGGQFGRSSDKADGG